MILVTGGSRGIGRAICLQLLEEGKDVIAVARRYPGFKTLQTQAQEKGGKLYCFCTDLSTPEGCTMLCNWIEEQSFSISVLINNAGQYTPSSLLAQDDKLEQLLQLNLLAAHRLTRELMNKELTHLVTIGSVAAFDFPVHMSAYTVSKYALHGWHNMMARELVSSGVSCLLVAPGATLTSSWDGESQLPEAILQPSDIAQAVSDQLANPTTDTIIIRPPL